MQPGRIGKGIWLGGVILFAAVMLLPVLWMVSTSLKSQPQLRAVMDSPAGAAEHFVDLPLHWRNYPEAWRALPFGRFLLNSVFIGLLAIVGEVVAAALAAYGLARFSFPGRKALMGFLLATLMIPPVVMMVPIFLIWQELGLVGAFDPLVLGALLGGGSLHVFILHQFMKTLPPELEEAARLDGASHGRIFARIILPQCTPVVLVICLISFQAHWNDFLGPLLYLNSPDQFTMTLGLHYFQANYLGQEPKWHWLMAITTLMAIPTVLIFLVTQRSFFAGKPGRSRGPLPPRDKADR
jgi:multiple sugar transport system permease protein